MKKHSLLFIALLIFCLFSHASRAQGPSNEFSLGYGLGTANRFNTTYSDVIVPGLNGGNLRDVNEGFSGVFFGSYQYVFPYHLAIGGTFGYEHGSADAYQGGNQTGTLSRNYFVMAFEADYRYVHTSNVALYSGMGIGASVYNETYNAYSGGRSRASYMLFDFQFTFIGARFGNKVGGFMEAGYGYKGIACGGIFWRW